MTRLALWCNGEHLGPPFKVYTHDGETELQQAIRHALGRMWQVVLADPDMAPCGPFKVEITRGDESEACGSITIQAGGELALPGYHEEIRR